MEKTLVCKLFRLGKDGDRFKDDLIAATLRTRVLVGADYVARFNKNSHISGQRYEIDEKATKERDAIKSGKPKADPIDKEIREALKAKADSLGIEYAKNLSNEKLDKLISEKENG